MQNTWKVTAMDASSTFPVRGRYVHVHPDIIFVLHHPSAPQVCVKGPREPPGLVKTKPLNVISSIHICLYSAYHNLHGSKAALQVKIKDTEEHRKC